MSRDLIVVAGLLVVGLAFAKKTSDVGEISVSPSPASITNQANGNVADMAGAKVLSASQNEVANAVRQGYVVVNEKGIIKADTLNEQGKPRITQDAQIYNIRTREGVATQITPNLNGNPLDVGYRMVSGNTAVSTRAPANRQEAEAARVSNIRAIERAGGYTAQQAAEKIAGAS